MNNSTHFRHFMFPLERLDRPKTVRVCNADPANPITLKIDIPIKGDVGANERQTVEALTAEGGVLSLDPLIIEIAQETAKHNGNDPVKIAAQLHEFLKFRGNTRYGDPVEEYRGYFLIHSNSKFRQFEQKLVSGQVDLYEMASAAFVMLKRASKTSEFDPAKLKIENLLDSEQMPTSILRALFHLYMVEDGDAEITNYLNEDGLFNLKFDKTAKKEIVKAEEESSEVIAGKS